MSTPAANTANCYIVDAPGYYMLPLVYGNAIKAGQDNPSAYSTDVSAANVLKTFLRHDDQPITAPYIYNNTFATGGQPADATLVWMDSPELVTEVKLSSDKHFLQFRLTPEAIAQGNAVLAIRNTAGEIMWSWHIWVTPLVSPTAPETDLMINRTNNHYNFMQYNLGWATATTMNYGAGTSNNQPREIRVRVKQTGISNPETETFVITQAPETVITKGNAPFWQFGRKDPFPPGNGLADGVASERQLWYGDATYIYGPSSGPVSLGTTVKNPYRIISNNNNWCSTNYNNLWDAPNAAEGAATMTDTTIVKTVYDPNPVGFNMPPSNAWTRFTLTGGITGNSTNFNVSNANTYISDGGYMFYTQADKNGPAVLYQTTGYRYQRLPYGVTLSTQCYSALPGDSNTGMRMKYIDGGVHPTEGSMKSLAFSVRPIAE